MIYQHEGGRLPEVAHLRNFLCKALSPRDTQTPTQALYNSGLVWLTNAVTFALWYFEIDSGGPDKRQKDGHSTYDFIFPQDQEDNSSWSPNFVDYLFLGFATNLTFGPTDTAVLSRRAKILTMVQSFLSVLIIAVVVARATAQ